MKIKTFLIVLWMSIFGLVAQKALAEVVKTNVIGPNRAELIYQVKPGDTYSRIAEKIYGNSNRWPFIANRNIYPSRALPVGAQIFIPISLQVQAPYQVMDAKQVQTQLNSQQDQINAQQETLKNQSGTLSNQSQLLTTQGSVVADQSKALESQQGELNRLNEQLLSMREVNMNLTRLIDIFKVALAALAILAIGVALASWLYLRHLLSQQEKHFKELLLGERTEVNLKGKKMLFYPRKEKVMTPEGERCFYSTLHRDENGKVHLVDDLRKTSLSVERTLFDLWIDEKVSPQERAEIEKAIQEDRLGEANFCH